MSTLRTLQHDFCAAVFSSTEDDVLLARHCAGSAPRMRAGIAAYRRSILANLASAVAGSYPLLKNIVGPDFINEAARRYAQLYPSLSGDLNLYGNHFGAFLATYPPATDLPWLPAVAEMEWEIQRVYGAPDAPAVDLVALQTTPPEQWEQLVFHLDPGHALIQSNWPLARIWEVNQAGYAGDMRVDFDMAQCVLVQRKGYDTHVELVAPGQFVFLKHLSEGTSLGRAVAVAMEVDAQFDFGVALQRFIGASLIRRAFLSEQS